MNVLIPIIFSALAVGFCFEAGKLTSKGKGALISGLLLGIGAAAATQNSNVIRYAWMTGAFGVVGMFQSENLDCKSSVKLLFCRNSRAYGLLGLILKGFLLFSIGSGFVSFGIMSLGMVSHTLADTILLFALTAVSPFVGTLLFNRGKNRLTLTDSKDEYWGTNLFTLASLFCIFLAKGDFFSLTVSLIGGFFGILGLGAATLTFCTTKRSFSDFVVGAFGGGGTALGIFVANRLFPNILSSGWFTSSGKFLGYIPQNLSLIFAALWCLLWALPLLPIVRQKEELKRFALNLIFCSIPFLLLSLGSYHAACLSALPLSLFAIFEGRFPKRRFPVWAAIICALTAASVLYFTTAIPTSISIFGSMLIFLGFLCFSKKVSRYSVIAKILLVISAITALLLWFLL